MTANFVYFLHSNIIPNFNVKKNDNDKEDRCILKY